MVIILSEKKKDKRPVKCPHCEEKLPRGEAIRHTNGRYYHKECYEKATQESRHYKELINYICKLHKIEKPTGMMLMQIKRFKEEFGFTYKGMELTLRYFYEILGNKTQKGDGVGIIPHLYDEAKEQYIKQMKINESLENLERKSERVVYISTKKRDKAKNMIDIETL